MQVVITGGAGFVGSHLSDALIARGDRVTALDDLSTGSERNLAQLRDEPGFELVVGSVLDRPLVAELVGGADAVVHLASPVGVELIVREPLRSIATMIHGTESVLDAARTRRTKVLIASTSEVYGKNTGNLDEEADHLIGPTTVPRWTYANAKALDEHLALGYWAEHRVPTVVFRLFNTVGPRQTGAYGMVLPRFVAQALLGEDLTVYGDGTQQRCFCHVSDAVRAIVDLLDEPRAVGRVFNIGSSEEVSVTELAKRVIELTSSESGIRSVSMREHFGDHFEDMVRRRPDTRRVRELTGWSPRQSLDSTIAHVIASTLVTGPRSLLPEAA